MDRQDINDHLLAERSKISEPLTALLAKYSPAKAKKAHKDSMAYEDCEDLCELIKSFGGGAMGAWQKIVEDRRPNQTDVQLVQRYRYALNQLKNDLQVNINYFKVPTEDIAPLLDGFQANIAACDEGIKALGGPDERYALRFAINDLHIPESVQMIFYPPQAADPDACEAFLMHRIEPLVRKITKLGEFTAKTQMSITDAIRLTRDFRTDIETLGWQHGYITAEYNNFTPLLASIDQVIALYDTHLEQHPVCAARGRK